MTTSGPLKIARMSAATVVAALVIALTAASGSAVAAFPGENGKIAFQSDRDGDNEIYTISFKGTNLTRLTNNSRDDRDASWSADGRRIAFSSGRRLPILSDDLYVMNANGSNKMLITDEQSIKGLSADDTGPSFSPNGRHIVFKRGGPQANTLHKIRVDGRNLRPMVGYNDAYDPTWSPDGTRMVYWQYYDRDEGDIWTNRLDGSGRNRYLTDGSYPDWSPDGSQIVFGRLDSEIYKMNAVASEITRLTSNTSADTHPAYAPGGGRIVFASNRDGDWDLYTMNTDGTRVKQLTNNPADEQAPAWRPRP